jgi:hypothetical protein
MKRPKIIFHTPEFPKAVSGTCRIIEAAFQVRLAQIRIDKLLNCHHSSSIKFGRVHAEVVDERPDFLGIEHTGVLLVGDVDAF